MITPALINTPLRYAVNKRVIIVLMQFNSVQFKYIYCLRDLAGVHTDNVKLQVAIMSKLYMSSNTAGSNKQVTAPF